MDFEKFENELVKRLTMRGVDVKVLPHVGVLNEARNVTKPQLFIILNNSTYSDPETLPALAQLENIQGEIFFRAKNRRGKMGIFALYERITPLLLGYRLEGAKGPVFFNAFGYVDGVQNNWQYVLTFSFSAYRMAGVKEETGIRFKGAESNINLK